MKTSYLFSSTKKATLKESYGTLSETINGLMNEGYTMDFNIRKECIVCHQSNTELSADDFVIDKTFRFEGETNPEDESIVYAISSTKYSVKGVLVNAYGIYSDDASAALDAKLKTHP